MSIQFARKQAEQLLRQLGLVHPPTDVNVVARHLALPIYEDQLGPDVSGALYTTGGRSYVIVQARDSAYRKRFTIAHEIGHFYLKHQLREGMHVDRGNYISHRGVRAAQGVDPIEIEANNFAAALLMPEQTVRDQVDILGCKPLLDFHVERLAQTFKVSEQAMTIRLTTLGLL